MLCVWDVQTCRFKLPKLPQRYEKNDWTYSWWMTGYTRLWQVYSIIWQVSWYTESSLNCVFITFESSITCSLHVLCMLAYSNTEKYPQVWNINGGIMCMYSSFTFICQHIPSHDVMCRYMVGYQGVRIPDAVWWWLWSRPGAPKTPGRDNQLTGNSYKSSGHGTSPSQAAVWASLPPRYQLKSFISILLYM